MRSDNLDSQINTLGGLFKAARLTSGHHLSYGQIPRRKVNLVDIKDIFRFVAPNVREAAIKTAPQLNHLGIRHALAGGLAVGAHGYIRATTDVNFLVGEEAFEHQGLLVAFKAGADLTQIRNYLKQYADDLAPLFEELVNEALAE